ncbi:uncharacterized protein LOC126907158 isoform X2 [Daktulosphaira vitifoliae]|uniref:uncharacterized protein LOC126907158 isoform X2 n=1 Tax=Daktulosphaira vitifoliae TaxID=58002 RepID=UPI0021AAFF12|nr:uncharacterized protein LOC126907158 isoform X2 [Daktulosphaira vitifoliae]
MKNIEHKKNKHSTLFRVKSDSRIDKMDVLLKNKIWKDMSNFDKEAGIIDNGDLCKVSEIIAKMNDRIVDTINLKTKIRQYFTLLSCVYSEWFKVIVDILNTIIVQQKESGIEWDAYQVLKELIKDYDRAASRMISSLLLLIDWFTDSNKKNRPMENNQVVTAINLLRTSFFKATNIDNCVKLLNNINLLLDEFQQNHLRIKEITSRKEEVKASIRKSVSDAIKSLRSPEDIQDILKSFIKKNENNFIVYFEELGFGYNEFFGTSFVLTNPSKLNETQSLYLGMRSYFLKY